MLELVPVEQSDQDLYIEIYTSDEIMRTIGGRMTTEQALAIHARGLGTVDKLGYKILQNKTRVGIISAWNAQVEEQTILEVGWIVLDKYHRSGIASSSIPLLIEKIKSQRPHADTIHAFCSRNGTAANALVQKMGFELIKPIERSYGKLTLDCNWWHKRI